MSLYLFDFSDPIPANHRASLPPYLHVNAATTYDILLLRLLTSTIEITNKKISKRIRLTHNFTTFPFHQVSRKSARQIRSLLTPFSIADYVKYSQKFYGRNIIFYHNLLQELTFYFNYSYLQQYQSAFVNLYRSLEYLSYSFPLIHSSHFSNYIGSFTALRSYLLNDKTGELKFFEKFVEKIFQGTPYLSLTTNFNFPHPDVNVANNCYDSFYAQMNTADWTTANRATHSLSIENSKLLGLFINARNRYFHFASGGQRNISNTDLKDPDFFFENINPKFLNWIAFIYSTVIRESLDNTLI